MNYHMYSVLNMLRRTSKCADKQVACIITDMEDNILSVGINQVHVCVNCNITGSKDGCHVTHAEMAALANLHPGHANKKKRAYISLFPCEVCQVALAREVDEIIVYNKQHKKQVIDSSMLKLGYNITAELIERNGEQKQLAVVAGELGELITEISNFFYRRHERTSSFKDLMDEIVDAELMIEVLLELLAGKYEDETLKLLYEHKALKLHKIRQKLQSGAIKTGSLFDKGL
jgi:deoxycytidylate deaminase